MPRPDLDNPFNITGLARPRIHEAVADQIRQAIFNGLLLPGHKLLPEREMAEKFQTSRVALREALRALEKEGMITIKRGSGELSRKLDMEFHRRVAQAANNPVLNIVVNAVNESIRDAIFRSKRSIEMRRRVVGYHRNILEALRSGDSARARAVMTEHVVDVQCHIETTDHE